MTEYCVVYLTVASEAEAETLANALVDEQLAACVNRVGPVQSTYRWQGQRCHDQEYLLIVKTRQSRLPELTQRVQALHSYDLPEVIALPILGGLAPYLTWIHDQTPDPNS